MTNPEHESDMPYPLVLLVFAIIIAVIIIGLNVAGGLTADRPNDCETIAECEVLLND